MAQDPWADFRVGPTPAPAQPPAQPPAQQQPSYPGVIRGAQRQPDPREIQSDARDETRLGIAVRGEQRDITNQGFNQANTLRDEYRTEPLVREYGTSIEQFAAGLNASPDAAGDQALITAYAKMLDPGSVVREGEFATTGQADNTFGQTLARIQREFGIEGGGRLSDTARQRVLAGMRNLVVQRVQRYDQLRRDYEERARRAGIDPFEVVGTHAAAPYVEMLRENDRERGIGQGATQANPQFTDPAAPAGPQPTLQDMYPEGAQLGMDNFGATDPFDRIAYLQGLGIEPEAERQFVGIVNATARQKGAENFTREDMLAAYQQAGIKPGPDAAIDEIVAKIRAGRSFAGFDTQAAEAEYTRMLDQRLQQGDNPEGMGATIGSAASQGVTLGMADEAMGLGEAMAALFRGENPWTAYQVGRDTDRRFAQRSQDANPITYGVTEFGTGLTTAGVRAAPAAMRAARPVAAAAREGAIMGGIAGFGHGEGLEGSAAGGVTGAVIGGTVGAGIAAAAPRVGNALANMRSPRPNAAEVQNVMQAGERMGVPVRRADVDPNVRQQRAEVLQSNAGQPVRDMEAEDLATMENALARAVGREGTVRDQVALGETVQRGASGILRSVRNRATRFYNRARGQSEGVTVQPENMLRAIDENIAELTTNGANQNAAQIRYLEGVREDIAGAGGLSIDTLRAQRTQMRGNINTAGLNMTDMERRMTNILRAASRDIEAGLANRPQALEAFREGDRLWREQALFERQIARRIIGTENNPVSPTTAAQRVTAFFNNDPARARGVWDQLSDETKGEVRAQLVANLGRQANGNFSLATFLTHTSEGKGALIPRRTMRLLFDEGGVEAINDLRTLAEAKVAAAQLGDRSADDVQRGMRGLRSLILGSLGVSEAGVTGGAVGIGASSLIQRMGEARAVRLLTNPDFTGWLRRLPETDNPRAIDRAFERLGRVAARDAQFQGDIQAFQQALIGAANDNAVVAGNVAASPEQQQEP